LVRRGAPEPILDRQALAGIVLLTLSLRWPLPMVSFSGETRGSCRVRPPSPAHLPRPCRTGFFLSQLLQTPRRAYAICRMSSGRCRAPVQRRLRPAAEAATGPVRLRVRRTTAQDRPCRLTRYPARMPATVAPATLRIIAPHRPRLAPLAGRSDLRAPSPLDCRFAVGHLNTPSSHTFFLRARCVENCKSAGIAPGPVFPMREVNWRAGSRHRTIAMTRRRFSIISHRAAASPGNYCANSISRSPREPRTLSRVQADGESSTS
jgi:hypothetical protein